MYQNQEDIDIQRQSKLLISGYKMREGNNWEHLYNATLHLLGCGKLSSHGQDILSSPHQDLKPREDCSYDSLLYPLSPKTWQRIRWENWKV